MLFASCCPLWQVRGWGLCVSMLRSGSVLGRLQLPAHTASIPSSLPEPSGKPGESSQCLWCLGGECDAPACPESLPRSSGARQCHAKCPGAPCAHPASGSGAGTKPGAEVPPRGLPCAPPAAITSNPAPLLGPEWKVAVLAGSGGFCHGETPQLLLRTPQLGLLPAAIQGL